MGRGQLFRRTTFPRARSGRGHYRQRGGDLKFQRLIGLAQGLFELAGRIPAREDESYITAAFRQRRQLLAGRGGVHGQVECDQLGLPHLTHAERLDRQVYASHRVSLSAQPGCRPSS